MKKIILFALSALLIFQMAFAAEADNKEILKKLFTDDVTKIAQYFDGTFLAAVPEEQLKGIIIQYKNELGDYVDSAGSDGKYSLLFKKGKAPGSITLNSNNKIIGLWLGTWQLSSDTKEIILNEIKNFNGKTAVTIIKNNKDILLDYNSNIPLASGSSFKLSILKALENKIEAKKAGWSDIILLNESNKSLPSGTLQNWPDGTPMTLKTLANMMISVSDNTAADTLLDYLGREAIEAVSPQRNKPFLTTLEMFKIKWGISKELQQKYFKAEEKDKRKILADLDKMDKNIIHFKTDPTMVNEVEWFYTTGELCQTIYELKNNDSIAINPGLVSKDDWYLAGYKGGSEPGVLQYTHVLQQAKDGDVYCISATINNPAEEVDTRKFTELVSRLIALIKENKL